MLLDMRGCAKHGGLVPMESKAEQQHCPTLHGERTAVAHFSYLLYWINCAAVYCASIRSFSISWSLMRKLNACLHYGMMLCARALCFLASVIPWAKTAFCGLSLIGTLVLSAYEKLFTLHQKVRQIYVLCITCISLL